MFDGQGWSREDYAKCPICGESYMDVETASIVIGPEDAEGRTPGMTISCVDCFPKLDAEKIEGIAKETAEYWTALNDWDQTWPEMKDTVAKSIREAKS